MIVHRTHPFAVLHFINRILNASVHSTDEHTNALHLLPVSFRLRDDDKRFRTCFNGLLRRQAKGPRIIKNITLEI
jgi:hypothetical protein